MFGTFERMVAFRYLRARRQEGFISVIAVFSLLGIGLGVATLIIVMSVMNGFRAEFLHQILGFNGDLTVYARDSNGLPNYDRLTTAARKLAHVTDAMPIVEAQAVAQAGHGWSGVQVRGERPDDLRRQIDITAHLIEGSIDDMDDESVLIGRRLAVTLNVRLNDNLTLLSPQGMPTAFGTVPRTKSYRIAGIFDTGMFQYDSGFVFQTLTAAQLFFHVTDAATAIQVFTDDPQRVDTVMQPLAQAMGENSRIYDWQGSNSPFLNAVKTERNVMFLILTLIIRGRSLQCDFQHDHAGARQGPGHRHSAHDGGDARHGAAHLLPNRRQHRCGGDGPWPRAGHHLRR